MNTQEEVETLALDHGWALKVHSPMSWWTYEYKRGNKTIAVRWRNGKLTALTIDPGNGVIFNPRRAKLSALRNEITA
jgi:hypothetical protein